MTGWSAINFFATAFAMQAVLLVLFGVFTDYSFGTTADQSQIDEMDHRYPMFQDVNVMIFIGFGFLMTFMHKYSFSAVGFNLLISCLVAQWSILLFAFWEMVIKGHFEKVGIEIVSIIDADFVAASAMISFGAVLGKLTPTQLLWVGAIHVVFNQLNYHILVTEMRFVDMGGSCVVHLYGASFGVAAAWALGQMNRNAHPAGIAEAIEKRLVDVSTTKTTDLFAMLGSIFLWMYWPSFNGALAVGAQQFRVVINTYLGLCSCAIMAFALSCVLRKGRKFSMVDIANATLAGGVAIGSSADLLVKPWGSILVGMVAGSTSTFGFVFIQPWLEEKIGLHDSCGVWQLHGIPGIIGGVAGAVSAGLSETFEYGTSIGHVYPAMAPSNATLAKLLKLEPGEDRHATYQAGVQMSAVLITFLIGGAAGLLCGFFVGSPLFHQEEKMFSDAQYWELHGEAGEHDGDHKKEGEELKNVVAAPAAAADAAKSEPTS